MRLRISPTLVPFVYGRRPVQRPKMHVSPQQTDFFVLKRSTFGTIFEIMLLRHGLRCRCSCPLHGTGRTASTSFYPERDYATSADSGPLALQHKKTHKPSSSLRTSYCCNPTTRGGPRDRKPRSRILSTSINVDQVPRLCFASEHQHCHFARRSAAVGSNTDNKWNERGVPTWNEYVRS